MKMPECWICMDEGFILYDDMDGYEYITHCTCKAGNDWNYDGRNCEKRPTKYYIPSAEELFDVQEFAKDNLMKWLNTNRDKPGVMEELKARGVQVDKLPA
jgi:hypothetical protein